MRNDQGEVGFRMLVGGGLGRTPMIGHVIRDFLPWKDLLSYLDAILRVYNQAGRRDNKYKARIKILVKEMTPAKFAEAVEREWAHLKDGDATLIQQEVDRIASRFTRPAYRVLPAHRRGSCRTGQNRQGVWTLGEPLGSCASCARLQCGDDLLEESWRSARRHDGATNGRGRRSGRPIQLWRTASHA